MVVVVDVGGGVVEGTVSGAVLGGRVVSDGTSLDVVGSGSGGCVRVVSGWTLDSGTRSVVEGATV